MRSIRTLAKRLCRLQSSSWPCWFVLMVFVAFKWMITSQHCLLATRIACRTSTALPTRTDRSLTRTSTTVMVSFVLPNKSSSDSGVSRCSLCIALFFFMFYLCQGCSFMSGFACLFVRWHHNARITRPILHILVER